MRHDGVMTFEQIGRELGITKDGARKIYQSALRKLRMNGRAQELATLAGELERQRGQRVALGPPDG